MLKAQPNLTCIFFTDPPYEPCKLKVVDSTKTSITLGWSNPEWDGGSEVTSYMVEKLVEGEQEWAMITSKGEVKITEYTVHDLKPDVNYLFRVSAVNCAGRGEPLEMTEPVQAKDILGKLMITNKMQSIFGLQFVCVLFSNIAHIYTYLEYLYDCFHRGCPD